MTADDEGLGGKRLTPAELAEVVATARRFGWPDADIARYLDVRVGDLPGGDR